jgi:hypothetical protein
MEVTTTEPRAELTLGLSTQVQELQHADHVGTRLAGIQDVPLDFRDNLLLGQPATTTTSTKSAARTRPTLRNDPIAFSSSASNAHTIATWHDSPM